MISGDLSAVKASVDAATAAFSQKVIGSFVLGNPHESVFPAIYGASEVIDAKALGVMETFNAYRIEQGQKEGAPSLEDIFNLSAHEVTFPASPNTTDHSLGILPAALAAGALSIAMRRKKR